ncbi:L-aspartate oxidase [Deinococcus roseus]|uniref:L-aspartate oxidase n=1 Tax=Deinococcus roseus TaxID=392414 RepID=A0ABQ2CTW1_9DEIO|nr:L-aspartate oxidase [Deinococcus roseus]GGJ20241.1 L-aspartate oxidase [Deinococcus roseus]
MQTHQNHDLLIVGSGITGLYAALHARSLGLKVLLISKANLESGSTFWAQGGLAFPTSPEDIEPHIQDTLKAGRGLCDEQTVRLFVEEAGQHLHKLLSYGVPFEDHQTLEGGHSHARVFHAWGDASGRAVSVTLTQAVRDQGIEVLEGAFVQALLISESGRVVGVQTQNQNHLAGAVLLASGGFGQLYPVTTAPEEATGDGIALAYRAGAVLRDMEFVQFHPTVYLAGNRGLLITEAARGEGAILLNNHMERFMQQYDPQGELAPRDVVARAIASEETRTGKVFLDLRHLGAEFVQHRFPSIYKRLLSQGVDISTELVPVSPAVHYTIGGILTDVNGKTTLDGLYAAGEVASSGLHGANRLASNSLPEGLVFGVRAVDAALKDLKFEDPASRTLLETVDSKASVQQVIRDGAGINRTAETLRVALSDLPRPTPSNGTIEELEAGNLSRIAETVLRGALQREESRGGHFRTDYPELDEVRHSLFQIPPLLETL